MDRLAKLEIIPLELRHLNLDLVFTYKLLWGMLNVSYDSFFQMSSSRTRGHGYKLYPQHFFKEIREHFYTTRIINIWNNLPENIASATTVAKFKQLLSTKEATDCLWSYLKGRGLV